MAKNKGFKAMPGGGVVAAPGASGASEGVQDISIYDDDIDMYLAEFLDSMQIDRAKINSMQWAAALRYIYRHTFKLDPSSILHPAAHGGYEYDILAVNALCDRYIDMCYTYAQRVCVEHFSFLSGISLQTIYTWAKDSRAIYIYDPVSSSLKGLGVRSSEKLTLTRADIYKKLVQNAMISADDLVLAKSGVNSIAYRNAVQERYSSRAAESVQALDVGSVADQLGISADVALLESSGV